MKALNVLLNNRYDIGADMEPLFLVFIADAVTRRLDNPQQMAESSQTGPFSVRWNTSAIGSWFLPAELAEMDQITGGAGARTYRTPAPDHIRFANRVAVEDEDDIPAPSIKDL